jgi:tetratricopeptide (TPR) repeat protein
MSIEAQFDKVRKQLASVAQIGLAETNVATDFAIDANAAGRADLSIALLEPLSKRAPDVAKVWQLLGLAYRDHHLMAEATAAFATAAQLAPNDPRIALGKAQVAYETGQPSAALFKALRKTAPEDGELALSTASAMVEEGEAAPAEAMIADMVRRQPRWLRGQDALASMRWMAGDQDQFDRGYADAVKVAPGDIEIWLAWYRAVAQVARWDRALAIIAAARRQFGDRYEFFAIGAHIASETGDLAFADALYERAAVLNNNASDLSYIRHLIRAGQFDRAEAKALPVTNTPAATAVWPYLSTIWRATGNNQAAWLDGDPPFIRHYDLPVAKGQLEALAHRLRGLHSTKHHPPEQSPRGGTQTLGHLFLRLEPEIQAIRALIMDAVRDYVMQLPAPVDGHPLLGTPREALLFEGAWSVRLSGQGFHVVHTHPLGWISSAFYVALPAMMGEGKAGWLQLGAPPPDLNIDLPAYIDIEPKPGRLALFPSTMWHGTIPFDDGERLTIAFDVRVPIK